MKAQESLAPTLLSGRPRGLGRRAHRSWLGLVVALCLAAAAAHALEWTPTAGPYGGVIYAFHTTNDGVTLTGTDSGEIYATRDGAISWDLLTDELPARSVLSFAEKDGWLYAGTDGRGVWRSDDGGATWANLDRTTLVNPTVRSMAVLNGVLYVGTTGGLSRFDEGGDYPDTWTTLSRGLRNVLLRELLVVDGKLLAATHGGVCGFDVEASRWAEQNVGLTRGNGVAPMVRALVAHRGVLFAGTATQGVFRSDDAGASWVTASDGLAPADASATSLNVNVLDMVSTDGALVVSVAGQGLFASEDTGETWARYDHGVPNRYANVLHRVGDSLLAGTYGTGVYRRVAGASTWTHASDGIRDTSVFALASDGAHLYMGGSGGVFVSSNGGDEWLPSNAGFSTLNLRGLSVIDGLVYAGTYRDGYYTSEDNGAKWTRASGELFSRLTVRAVTRMGGRYYAATAGQGVIVSEDGVTSWTPRNEGIELPYITMLRAVGDRLYAGTDGKGVYVSDDGAETWARLGSGMAKPFVFAMATLGDRVFVATYGSGVYQLNGDEWEPRSVGLGDLQVRSLVAVGDTLYAGTAEAGVFVSDDAGITWVEVNDGWSERRVRVLLVVGDTLYAGTARGGVYKAQLP
jgi:photosystem II stability/assembly factor-like uncharacterized protein